MYRHRRLDDDLDADDDEDYAPRKSAAAMPTMTRWTKTMRWRSDHPLGPADHCHCLCTLIIAVSLVYHFVLA